MKGLGGDVIDDVTQNLTLIFQRSHSKVVQHWSEGLTVKRDSLKIAIESKSKLFSGWTLTNIPEHKSSVRKLK